MNRYIVTLTHNVSLYCFRKIVGKQRISESRPKKMRLYNPTLAACLVVNASANFLASRGASFEFHSLRMRYFTAMHGSSLVHHQPSRPWLFGFIIVWGAGVCKQNKWTSCSQFYTRHSPDDFLLFNKQPSNKVYNLIYKQLWTVYIPVTGSTQPREYNWGATWKKRQRLQSRKPRIRP
jgi:hypothetical protein